MDDHAVSLSGTLTETETLRHTPAGLPILGFKVAHKSLKVEAGFKRQVECEVVCVAMGEAATKLSRTQAGAAVKVTGFLNRKNRMSTQLVLHATETEILN